MKKWLVLIAAITLVLVFTACGGGSSENAATEDGQNPVMNFIGNYACDRAEALVEADGEEGARITVNWAGSAWDNAEWVMSGTFDSDSLLFEYHDCVKTEYVYDEDGEIKSQEEVYVGGHGFIQFADGDPLSFTWQEDQEHIADDMIFTYVGAGENLK